MRGSAIDCVLTRFQVAAISAAIGTVAVGTAIGQPLGSLVPPNIDNPNRLAVSGTPAAKRFMSLARSRRVDVAIIGDSNTRQLQTTGHENGMGRAFADRFGMYATRVTPYSGQGSWGASVLSEYAIQYPPFIATDEPAAMDAYTFAAPQLPIGFAVLPAGVSLYTTYNLGYGVFNDHPVDITAPLRYHVTDFPMPGGGSYVFTVRAHFPGSAFLNIVSVRPTLPADGNAPRDFSFDVPAGPRPETGLLFCPADAQNGQVSVGPLAIAYCRLENLSRTHGIAYSPMWFEGGQDARKCLQDLLASPRNLTAMAEWMRQATRIQNNTPVLLVHILHGGNDAGDSAPSLGPIGGLNSRSLEGHQDNIQGIINWLRTVWTGTGNDSSNLFFLLGPYHPRDDRTDYQHDFEQAWRNLASADPQVISIAGTMLSTPEQFIAKGFNRSTVDAAHLAPVGYIAWGTVTVRALSRAACPADFDENGTLSLADIFDFLDGWFSSDIATDFNYTGALEVQDIFDMLTAWFSGC